MSRDKKSRTILSIIYIFGFLIPFVVMTGLNLMTLQVIKSKGYKLRKLFNNKLSPNNNERTISSKSSLLTRSSLTVSMENTSTFSGRHRQRREGLRVQRLRLKNNQSLQILLGKREEQATKSIFICISLFCLAWLPNFLLVFATNLGQTHYASPLTSSLASIFTKTLVIINPILYTVSNFKFRLYVKQILFFSK